MTRRSSGCSSGMAKEGVERKLVSLGARHGDEVAILDRVFEFLPDVDPRR